MGWLSALGGIAGNILMPGAGGALGGMLGGALEGKKGGSGGGMGSAGTPAYVPEALQEMDKNFQFNKNAYQYALEQQKNTIDPYNQQLLQSQFNSPWLNNARDIMGWAQDDYLKNAQQLEGARQPAWNYANQQGANAAQMQGLYNQGLGNVQKSVQQLYQMGDESNKAYQDLINYQKGQLGQISGAQGNLYAGGNQVLQTALDPQKDLYNRTLGQVTDQSRAAQYARGIQSTPYGAAIESANNANFNIDWQNQQLARQAQGLQAAQGAYGNAQNMGNQYTGAQAGLQAGKNDQYANLTNAAQNQYTNYLSNMNQNNLANTSNYYQALQGAANVGNQSGQALQNALAAGYGANQMVYQNQNQALQNYQQNQQPYFTGLGNLQQSDLNYMNVGQGAQAQNFNQAAFNQQQRANAISGLAGPLSEAVGAGANKLFNDSSFGDWAFNSLGGLGGSL